MKFFIALAFGALLIALAPARAGWFDENFLDPDDNRFDTSAWLLKQTGFLPVPILITEPAVGYGAGLAALFFHGGVGGEKRGDGSVVPPSITGIVYAATENGSRFGGVGHLGVWRQDRVRYTGVLGGADINLAFYGLGGAQPDDGLDFEMSGLFVLQTLLYRLGDTPLFVGPRQIYLDTRNTFRLSDWIPLPGVPDLEFDNTSSGLGIEILYDSRDNTLSPNAGIKGVVQATWYEPAWGSDERFEKYRGAVHYYRPLTPRIVLGARIDATTVSGTAPFYEYPYIDMRDIKAMRYQGKTAWMAELEGRFALDARWSLVLFGGAGEALPVNDDTAGEGVVFSKGVGFRYLLARKLGLQAGLDVARGPDDTAIYIQVGSAWR